MNTAKVFTDNYRRLVSFVRKNLKNKEDAEDNEEDDEDVNSFLEILSSNESTPETETLRLIVWKEIEAAIDELSDAQRDIFVQTEFLGFPVKEISQKTGVPVNTLLSRKHYAIKHLRKRLKELYIDVMKIK